MSLFGLHRWLRGAAIGHFAATEITSPPGSRRMVQALQRLDAPPACIAFYGEHVEADAVHEQVVRHDVVGDLVAREPNLDRDVVFGIRAHAVVENRLADNVDGGVEAGSVVVASDRSISCLLIRFESGSAAPMAGVAQRIFLAARTGADQAGQYLAVSLSAADEYVDVPAAELRRAVPARAGAAVPGGGRGAASRTFSSPGNVGRRSGRDQVLAPCDPAPRPRCRDLCWPGRGPTPAGRTRWRVPCEAGITQRRS